ncbi:MAG: SDR family oxidoreductase [Bacillota bacterium]
MAEDLKDKVAVVSGASRGLGRAVALELASRGARVALLARDPDRLGQVAGEIEDMGASCQTYPCDVAEPESVLSAARGIEGKWGRCDILVNNAGIPAPRGIDGTDFDEWDRVLRVNLFGAFYLTRALWELLCAGDSGYVINISGGAGKRGGISPGYGASKFGLEGLTASIAASGSEQDVRATALYPGSMDTGWRDAPIGEKPTREIMDPAEVARFVGYLVTTPKEFVINEAILNPIAHPWG